MDGISLRVFNLISHTRKTSKRVRCTISKTRASVSSGYPNTEKWMKARGRRPSAFIVSRCLEYPDETRSTSFGTNFSWSHESGCFGVMRWLSARYYMRRASPVDGWCDEPRETGASLILVWRGANEWAGLARQTRLHRKISARLAGITGLAQLSCNHEVDFYGVKQTCRDTGKLTPSRFM